MKSYEVIVIGGGPAGATAALILARAGWSVAVLEKARFPRRKVCGEFISATSLPLLRELGVCGFFLTHAGAEVRQVGLCAGDAILFADMPRPWYGSGGYGRALGREHLDTLLLTGAANAGATIWQPWTVTGVAKTEGAFVCTAVGIDKTETANLTAPIIIAAHGSWMPGTLPTQRLRYPRRANDLFAFKAHFRNAELPQGLMPLLVFPGGYGGMVHSDGSRTTLSCCIRRDTLERCRQQSNHVKAAETVFAHIQASCRRVGEMLAGATLDGAWLSAGPIRPGIRSFRDDGIFAIGNAAGEAHPIIAEGISMAMQSAWLLCERLIACKGPPLSGSAVKSVAYDYAASWRGNFGSRTRAAAVFAHLAMRPATAKLARSLLERVPAALTLGAYLSGKAQPLSSLEHCLSRMP